MGQRITNLEKKSLKRVLKVADLFGVGYGDVGSSIYYALGVTALYAGGATPVALLLAGIFFICTALTYAEMATTFPEAGGSAMFTRHAFNDLLSFIAGWGLLLDYIVTTAISAYAVPSYLQSIFVILHIPYDGSVLMHLMLTIGIIGGLFLLNVWGVKESGRLSMILTIFTIVTQALIILLAAFFFLNLPYVLSHMRVGVEGLAGSPTWPNFLKGVAMAMVAYTGIEAIAQLAAETRHPEVMIPRAIRWVVVVVLLLYLGVATVGLSVISPEELGTTYVEDPVAGIVANFPFGGEWLAPWVGGIAAVILLVCANAGLLGASRLTFSMGEYYQLPQFFYRLHEVYHTPYVSLALFSFLAAMVVLASRGQMLFLADIYNFGAQIAFFFAHLSLLCLRIRSPQMSRPYKAPFNIPIGGGRSVPITALLGLMISFSVWLIVVITKVEGRFFGLTWLLIGTIIYFLYRKAKKLSPMGQLNIETISVPGYVPVHFRRILTMTDGGLHLTTLQMACQLAKTHQAELTIVHIIEVPASMPLEESETQHKEYQCIALKQGEAVAREYGVTIALEVIRARSKAEALLILLRQGLFDMAILEAAPEDFKKWGQFAASVETLGRGVSAKLLFCSPGKKI